MDSALQQVTLLIMKGMIPTIQLIDLIGKGSQDSIQNHLEQMSDSVRLLSAAVNYLSQARKDVIRNDLHGSVARFCTWETPVGVPTLFCDDVAKKFKESAEEYKLVSSIKKGGYSGYGGKGKYQYKNKKNGGFWE